MMDAAAALYVVPLGVCDSPPAFATVRQRAITARCNIGADAMLTVIEARQRPGDSCGGRCRRGCRRRGGRWRRRCRDGSGCGVGGRSGRLRRWRLGVCRFTYRSRCRCRNARRRGGRRFVVVPAAKAAREQHDTGTDGERPQPHRGTPALMPADAASPSTMYTTVTVAWIPRRRGEAAHGAAARRRALVFADGCPARGAAGPAPLQQPRVPQLLLHRRADGRGGLGDGGAGGA